MFCTKCSTENSTEAHYCYNCGTKLSPTEVTPVESPHTRKSTEATDSDQNFHQTSIQQTNFIVKHWRGDYSLGISYWVFGSLLTVVVVAIATMIGSTSDSHDLGAESSGFIILTSYIFFIALTIWQLVGIWRSADKHHQRGGKRIWAGLAKVMVVLGLFSAVAEFSTQGIPLISEGTKLLVGIDDTPPHSIRLLRDGTELELAGGMPFGTTDAISKFLDAAPSIQVLHLNSQGGRMNEAFKLYKLIKAKNLITYTSTECASACSFAFLAGRERYISENGRLGFHSASIGESNGDIVQELNYDIRQTLRTHGVPDSFINQALSTSPNDMWYPSANELLAANVIDSVVDSRYFGLSGVTQWRDAHKIESEFLTNPIYSVLAQYDQENYVKLRNILVSGIQKGRPQIEIQSDIRSILVAQLIPKYLKLAPDEVLIRYWRSQIAEMKYFEKLNPQYCADFVYPQYANSVLDLQSLIPSNLMMDDIDSLVAVIKGVAVNPQESTANSKTQADLKAVMMKIKKKHPNTLRVIANPENYKNDPDSLCKSIITLYSEILALPSNSRSGAVLRHMLSE